MRLHASPIPDTNLGVRQIHLQLESLHLELQSLKKEKETKPEVCAEIWCLKCKGHGHDKDHFPIYVNYIIGGGPIPLKLEANIGTSMGAALWCIICQVTREHATNNFHLLQKFVQTPQQRFCNFL